MDKKLETLYKLCEALMEELEDYSKKIEKSDGMSAGDLEAVDKLTHALKSVKTTIAMMEAGDEGGSSYRGGNSNRFMPWYGGMSYEGGQGGGSSNAGGGGGSSNRGGNSNRGGMSSARRGGRGNNPTGRNQYSREGYSYAEEEFQSALEEALNAAPDDHVREKLQRIMDEI